MFLRALIVVWEHFLLLCLISTFVHGEVVNESADEHDLSTRSVIFRKHSFKDYVTTNTPLIDKCTEYQKVCSTEPSKFVMNGVDAAAKEFPHMALIGDKRKDSHEIVWHCGGALISEKFVLTAAHCMRTHSLSATYVRLGDLDIETEYDDAEVKQFNIVAIFIHPEYLRRTGYNDIALVQIDKAVEFNQFIRPACVGHLLTPISEKVIATGWGRTSSSSSTRHSHLQKVQLEIIPFDRCEESFHASRLLPQGIINRTQLCAGSNIGERDSCEGFGGGPLLNTGRKLTCLYEIIGVTSLGFYCGNGYPGVYTRVASYLQWIEDIVWQ